MFFFQNKKLFIIIVCYKLLGVLNKQSFKKLGKWEPEADGCR